MFSSLASFLFGSSTSATTNCEPNKNSELGKEQTVYPTRDNPLEGHSEKDTITEANVPTLLTSGGLQDIATRNENKRNNRKNKNKKQLSTEVKRPFIAEAPTSCGPETLQSSDGDFDLDDNDWFFVEKEGVKSSNSFSRRSSEEKLSLIKDNNGTSTPVSKLLEGSQLELASLHQKYVRNGSRKNQDSNRQKRNRNTNARNVNNSYRGTDSGKILLDGGIMQSLYAAPGCHDSGHSSGASNNSNGCGTKLFTMVDSWYLTPPPCFTSNGPIHMEISPLENLLIEHPRMSVYHSIRSVKKATESSANFDLKVNDSNQIQGQTHRVKMPQNRQRKQGEKENLKRLASPKLMVSPTKPPAAVIGRNTEVVAEERATGEKENLKPLASPKLMASPTKPLAAVIGRNTETLAEGRATGPRIDRYTAAQLKMELFAWNSQKCMVIRDRQTLRRNAILRANKVREIQGKGNRQRRSDFQHCQLISGVNNNRKCCY